MKKKYLAALILITSLAVSPASESTAEPSMFLEDRFPNCEELEYTYCDPNDDFSWDVLDIVFTVSVILGTIEYTDEQLCSVDTNYDEVINILDVVFGMASLGCWNPGE